MKTKHGEINDDAKHAEEVKRKRSPKVAPATAMLDGPCCGRCNHWMPPRDGDDYGTCRIGFIKQATYPESRVFLSYDEVRSRYITGVDSMRTTAAFAGCSQYNKEIRRDSPDARQSNLSALVRRER